MSPYRAKLKQISMQNLLEEESNNNIKVGVNGSAEKLPNIMNLNT